MKVLSADNEPIAVGDTVYRIVVAYKGKAVSTDVQSVKVLWIQGTLVFTDRGNCSSARLWKRIENAEMAERNAR